MEASKCIEEKIKKIASEIEPELIQIRHTLHQHPELGIDLPQTHDIIAGELKKIPGIGSSIARMIVNYRERLGGFFRIEQLQEIHLKAEKLRPWFSIDTHQTRRINVNKAGMERMMHHPYINYYQARVIVEHRKKKGRLKSLKQLSLYEEFTSADLERIEPYICYD